MALRENGRLSLGQVKESADLTLSNWPRLDTISAFAPGLLTNWNLLQLKPKSSIPRLKLRSFVLTSQVRLQATTELFLRKMKGHRSWSTMLGSCKTGTFWPGIPQECKCWLRLTCILLSICQSTPSCTSDPTRTSMITRMQCCTRPPWLPSFDGQYCAVLGHQGSQLLLGPASVQGGKEKLKNLGSFRCADTSPSWRFNKTQW